MTVKVIKSKSDSPVSTTQVLSKLRGTFLTIKSIHTRLLGFL